MFVSLEKGRRHVYFSLDLGNLLSHNDSYESNMVIMWVSQQ